MPSTMILQFFSLIALCGAVSTADSDCIIHEKRNDSHLIFDDDNTTCQRLNMEGGVASIKLEVKTSCVNTTDVEFLSILEGHAACESLSILFVNHTNTSCQRRSRCLGSEISADGNYTTCLLKCPKRVTADGKYEVHLLYTNFDPIVNLCDLRIGNGLCFPNPCKHNESCMDEISSYKCQCAEGYTGNECDTNVNECSSFPCLGGGTCRDGVNSYQCECAEGYSGENCENDINECRSDPCQNDGQCADQVASYKCTCLSNFTGKNCEGINACVAECDNHGFCSEGSCSCSDGYSGYNCQYQGDCPKIHPWTKPSDFGNGPNSHIPNFYMPFHDSGCVAFYNGALLTTIGKVGRGISTDGVDDWISLGNLSGITCIVNPDQCKPNDKVTVLAWLKFDACGNNKGIISSYAEEHSDGFSFGCSGQKLRYTLGGSGKYFSHDINAAYDTWTHVAMIYKAQEITVYMDASHQGQVTEWTAGVFGTADGELMIGRLFKTNIDGNYVKCEVDEIIIFNKKLLSHHIEKIYKSDIV